MTKRRLGRLMPGPYPPRAQPEQMAPASRLTRATPRAASKAWYPPPRDRNTQRYSELVVTAVAAEELALLRRTRGPARHASSPPSARAPTSHIYPPRGPGSRCFEISPSLMGRSSLPLGPLRLGPSFARSHGPPSARQSGQAGLKPPDQCRDQRSTPHLEDARFGAGASSSPF